MSKRMPASVCWPYRVPTKKEDKTGTRHGLIVFVQALYYITKKREWVYLGLCDCGKETLTTGFLSIAPHSCGCTILNEKRLTRTSALTTAVPECLPTPPLSPQEERRRWPREHNRSRDCISTDKFIFKCEHYSTCLDEKVFAGKVLPTLFEQRKGRCYTAPMEELAQTIY